MAALHLASEDDAIRSRTHIPLPVDSFSARLDSLVATCGAMMPRDAPVEQQLAFISTHLFNTWGLKVAANLDSGLYSPYRVYLHNVLAQRAGTQAACAAVLHSLLQRLTARGALTIPTCVGLPMDIGSPPCIQALPPHTDAAPGAAAAASTSGVDAAAAPGEVDPIGGPGSAGLVRWVTGQQLVAELLDQLKRAYWSWDWPLGAASGFEACARSLLGERGRAGKVNAAVGVMQASGRPFGNVELALLASERLAQVTQAMGADSWQHQVQVRDVAIQLMHVGESARGCELLRSYLDWLSRDPDREGAGGSYAALCSAVLLSEQRKALEGAYQAGSPGPADILDPDRDA